MDEKVVSLCKNDQKIVPQKNCKETCLKSQQESQKKENSGHVNINKQDFFCRF